MGGVSCEAHWRIFLVFSPGCVEDFEAWWVYLLILEKFLFGFARINTHWNTVKTQGQRKNMSLRLHLLLGIIRKSSWTVFFLYIIFFLNKFLIKPFLSGKEPFFIVYTRCTVECPNYTTCDEKTSTTHFLVPFCILIWRKKFRKFFGTFFFHVG